MFKKGIRVALVAGLLLPCASAMAQDNVSGSYLAARQAAVDYDFENAALYYTRALVRDPLNPRLLESAMLSYVALGDVTVAGEVAQTMRQAGIDSQLGNLVLDAIAAKTGQWDAIFASLEEGHSVSPLVDGLAQAWAAVGKGQMTKALSNFDEVVEAEGMRTYGLYHKALALAHVGDFEGANAIFADEFNATFTARAVLTRIQILSQLGRADDGLQLLEENFGSSFDPRIAIYRARLMAGQPIPFDIVTSPADGFGEIAFMIAELLEGETREELTLQYARVAQFLDPDDSEKLMMTADLLGKLGRYALASEAFAQVAPDDSAYPAAELGRIAALQELGQPDVAIEVATALSRSHAELPLVHAKLGDLLRGESRFQEAYDAYTTAIDAYGPDNSSRWMVLYTRAIAAHAMDEWPLAEADFRAALVVQPDQPHILNYLGYSLVERGEKLDEALEMIEKAVAARPDNGAIVDSLGWVLYTLGRYEEAVPHMEQAASLEATDPIVNDHLGDVYWMVGREIEANFQWNRALSFDPEDALAQRIRDKLARGLDAVLAEEAANPVDVANDDG